MMQKTLTYILAIAFIFASCQKQIPQSTATKGSMLWQTNMQVNPKNPLKCPTHLYIKETTPTFNIIAQELQQSLKRLYKKDIKTTQELTPGCLYVGTSKNQELASLFSPETLKNLGSEGFIIREIKNHSIAIIGNNDIAALYGTYHFLRWIQTGEPTSTPINITEKPSYKVRILDHWDNLDGTVERGYAGHSLWQWEELPQNTSPRYQAYAKANASIGINGTVLNNVNANPDILKASYLEKTKALADIFRPYGIKVYLSINFSSPAKLGGLTTSDPLNEQVHEWWAQKVKEIYALIPDFGGFLVKANSEGLPGPQDFGRTHADGANMLADALQPYGGIVMWRAFVYKSTGGDRAKQAYNEFMPLDGKFKDNVLLQVKNGPIDFQPREPFNPLFGNMQHTTLMPELQITQEYLGFSDHLVYLGTLFKEFLDADTYTQGKNTTIAKITDGSLYNDSITGIAGVANIGLDTNWCGHQFAQANWYVFGRLAWNNQLSVKQIAKEWLEQTFTHDTEFVNKMADVMMESREAVVNYMTPIGLHHLMGWDHHYGPEPWCEVPGARPDWLPSYYHKADSIGIGFDRTTNGSNAVSQYAEPLRSIFNDPKQCPEEYLLWFHHLPWGYKLDNGNDVWAELCNKYQLGVEQAQQFQQTWNALEGKIDTYRFNQVKEKLAIQVREAKWWRDACTLYFQTFSKQPIPEELFTPLQKLDTLKKLKFNFKHHN